MSLRASAADLAAKGYLSPSDRPYLMGSIANMLRRGSRAVDAAAPIIVDGDLEVEIDIEDDTQPAAHAVDAVPTLPADVAPIVDAAAFDVAHDLPALDVDAAPADAFDGMQQPLTEAKPQSVDAAPPAVDAEPVKQQWQPQRGQHGLIDFRSLLTRLIDVPHLQEAAMASVNLRIDQMGLLADRGDWRETVANWLSRNT
ncbi:MAG: hypothetical protein ACLPTF_16635 [Steroidobacteraceae bacterium]